MPSGDIPHRSWASGLLLRGFLRWTIPGRRVLRVRFRLSFSSTIRFILHGAVRDSTRPRNVIYANCRASITMCPRSWFFSFLGREAGGPRGSAYSSYGVSRIVYCLVRLFLSYLGSSMVGGLLFVVAIHRIAPDAYYHGYSSNFSWGVTIP